MNSGPIGFAGRGGSPFAIGGQRTQMPTFTTTPAMITGGSRTGRTGLAGLSLGNNVLGSATGNTASQFNLASQLAAYQHQMQMQNNMQQMQYQQMMLARQLYMQRQQMQRMQLQNQQQDNARGNNAQANNLQANKLLQAEAKNFDAVQNAFNNTQPGGSTSLSARLRAERMKKLRQQRADRMMRIRSN